MVIVFRFHTIELRPTASQEMYFRRCAGTMRFAYNSLVAKWLSGEKYTRRAYQKHCIDLRQSTPWMNEVASRATYEAVDNFHMAVLRFFKTCKNKSGKKWKPPTFKKKRNQQSFQLSHSTFFSVQGRNLRVQGLPEQIRMREIIRFAGAVKAVTIKLHAGKWFASFLVEMEAQPVQIAAQKPSVGVDLGIHRLATLSTGETIENPQPLRRQLRLLRRRQRQVSRKLVKGQKQSNRHQIASQRVARLHKKICDRRSAAQHQFTSRLVKRFGRIVIEDLAVSNMLKNRNLSRAIGDAGFATIRRQLEYKCKMAGVELVISDRFFASSQTCSGCGMKLKKNMSLSSRTFKCAACSLSLDRDRNAAINLFNWKQNLTPPIRGSQKTRNVELCKPDPQGEAGLSDVANINPQLKGSLPCSNEQMVVIY